LIGSLRRRVSATPPTQENGLVFASSVGTARNANNVLRSFRSVVARTSLTANDWTPREMRHSFVSLLSDSGVPIENIARLVSWAWRRASRVVADGPPSPGPTVTPAMDDR
jgi:site-specific recombinase XerD